MMGGAVYSGLLALRDGLLRPLVVPSISSSVSDAPRPLAQCAISGSATAVAAGIVRGWGLVPMAVGVLDGTCDLVSFLPLLGFIVFFFLGARLLRVFFLHFAKLPAELLQLSELLVERLVVLDVFFLLLCCFLLWAPLRLLSCRFFLLHASCFSFIVLSMLFIVAANPEASFCCLVLALAWVSAAPRITCW